MATLFNWHKAPLVVTDKAGARHTIKSNETAVIDGDFSSHPLVLRGLLSVDGKSVSGQLTEDDEKAQLRQRYKSIYGTAAPGNASAELLRQRIEEWQQQDA
jgi:hypothetical protein